MKKQFQKLCLLIILMIFNNIVFAKTDGVEVRHGFVNNNGVKISYFEYKTTNNILAPILVVTGGWPWNSNMFDDFSRDMAKKGVRVIRYDQRGSGASDHLEGVDNYSLPILASDFKVLIDTVAPGRKVNVFGEAWGPFIASEYTNIDPGKVTSIISAGAPSLDLAIRDLYTKTAEASKNPRLLLPVASQWTALSYFFAISIKTLPEIIISNGIATKIVNYITKMALDDEKLKAEIKDIRSEPTTIEDTKYGINKYRWFVYNRLKKPKYDYINVPQLKVYQMDDDVIETELLIHSLKDKTPNLVLIHLPGGHQSFLSKEHRATIIDGILQTIRETPQF